MKVAKSVLVVALVLLAFVGAAIASEISGVVTAVSVEKNTMAMKSATFEGSYNKDGSLLKDVKVGDSVTVEYVELEGKKVVVKIMPMKKDAVKDPVKDTAKDTVKKDPVGK
jgi:hypothetical protein